MEIKRKSWHYKVNHIGKFERDNDNLCKYFWRLVGNLAVWGFIAFVGSVFLFAAYKIVFAYFTSIFFGPITVVLLFSLSSIILPKIAIVLLRKRLGKSPKMPCGNIAIEYIKAWKSKMCPLIKYV